MSAFPGPENIVTATLTNGLRVLVYENFATETIVLDAYAPGGSLGEDIAQAGVAALTAAMLRRDTHRRSFDAINEVVESVGASFGFGAGWHMLSCDARCLREDFDLVLALLTEGLVEPAFDTEEFVKVRTRTLTGIQERQHNPRAMAGLAFRAQLFPGGHAYGRPLSGFFESVSSLTCQDLEAFHRSRISPEGGVIAVAGAIAAEDAIARLERTLGTWRHPGAQPLAPPPDVTEIDASIEQRIVIPGKSQSDIILGRPAIPHTHPDFMPFVVANQILGRFGMGGRLGENIRERQGMAYYAYSSFESYRMAGAWLAAAGVHPRDVTRTVQAIRDEVALLRRAPATAVELADVQAKLTGSLPLDLETNAGIAGELLDMAWYDEGLDYLERYPQRVNAVTLADVQRIAQTYLDPDRTILTVAGPEH